GDEHVLEGEVAAHGAAHAHGFPVAADAQAFAGGGHADVERVARVGMVITLVFGAQDAVVVGRAREAGPDFSAVDEPAAIDLFRAGAEGRAAGGGGRAFAEGLGVER